MTSNRFPDEDELEQQHERERRLEIAREQEPIWVHYRSRNRFLGPNRPGPERRYFSRIAFRPVDAPAVTGAEEAA
jgi:hypothetical protein